MAKWSIRYDYVQMWDDEQGQSEGKFVPVSLEIRYDDSEVFHFHGQWESETGRGSISSVKLDVKFIGQNGLVALSGTSFIFTDEQIKELQRVNGSWAYESGDTSEIPLEDRKPRYPCPNDLGIVYWYSDERDSFVLANFKIDFDWQAKQPVIFFIADFDDSMMPQHHYTVMNESLNVEYMGENNGYHVYSVSGQSLLLTVEQAAFINNLVAKL